MCHSSECGQAHSKRTVEVSVEAATHFVCSGTRVSADTSDSLVRITLVGFFILSRRMFLERRVAGPKALRLWPGLYFDSDADGTVREEGRMAVSLKVRCMHRAPATARLRCAFIGAEFLF